MDQLETFVEGIVTTKDLPGLTDESKKQLVAEMSEQLIERINAALIAALPDEKVAEFSDFLDAEQITDEQVQAFIAQSGVDVQKVTAETMLTFRNLYLRGSEG